METASNSKCMKFLNDSNYLHCSICGDFNNMNAFAHRKSKNHKKRLNSKLRKIAFHLTQKKKKVTVHDEGWPERDFSRFCHFCAQNYNVHFKDGEFVVEDLGALYHHADSNHVKSVEKFLSKNFSKENYKKFCIQEEELDSTLKEVAVAKTKYLKKMQLLNDMIVNQIKTSEEERRKLLLEVLQVQASCSTHEEQILPPGTETAFNIQNMSNSKKNETEVKVPPWLENVADNSVVDSGNVSTTPIIGPTLDTLMKHVNSVVDNGNVSTAPIIGPTLDTLMEHVNSVVDSGNVSTAPITGPTLDTLMEHVENEKKKGLPEDRVGAKYHHYIRPSTKISKWCPTFHGTWNRRRRKGQQGKFKAGK